MHWEEGSAKSGQGQETREMCGSPASQSEPHSHDFRECSCRTLTTSWPIQIVVLNEVISKFHLLKETSRSGTLYAQRRAEQALFFNLFPFCK